MKITYIYIILFCAHQIELVFIWMYFNKHLAIVFMVFFGNLKFDVFNT